MIATSDLVAGYANKPVLHGVSISAASGEIVGLIGHNGSGKSTLLKALFGLVPAHSGEVFIKGELLRQPSPRKLLAKGISYVPQGKNVFANLTVRENIQLSLKTEAHEADTILELFPELTPHLHRTAGTLSGGERQLLALAIGLSLSREALLLDEPSAGLSPYFLEKTWERIKSIHGQLNISILIVEHRVSEILKFSTKIYVLRSGRITFGGSPEMLSDQETLKRFYL